jgi:hypothetical protein
LTYEGNSSISSIFLKENGAPQFRPNQAMQRTAEPLRFACGSLPLIAKSLGDEIEYPNE